jgi:hypothetical protein
MKNYVIKKVIDSISMDDINETIIKYITGSFTLYLRMNKKIDEYEDITTI